METTEATTSPKSFAQSAVLAYAAGISEGR